MPISALVHRVARRLRRVLRPDAHARDLNDELHFHLEMEIEHNVRSGLSPDAARAKARRELGAVGEFGGRPGAPDERPGAGAVGESIVRDLRIAARSLLRTPGFSVIAVLTIALGVGATTAVYSAIDGVLLRPLPYPAPDRLVRIYERSATYDRNSVAGANALDIQARAHTLARAAYANANDEVVLGGDEPVRTRVSDVSAEFFDVFGVRAAQGRLVGAGEGRPNGPQVAVVSDAFWRNSLGADRAFGRRTLRIGTDVYPVVGVMPASFNFPSRVDVWVTTADDNPSRTSHNWMLVGRLAPDATTRDAQTEVDALLRGFKAQYGKETDAEGALVIGLHEDLARAARTTLLILLGAVGFVLLVACVNLASANLARGETRQREYAVRTALGAGRGRIVRQVLTENLVLAAVGGALGCAIAYGLTRVLVAFGAGALPRFADVRVDGRVLLFAGAASLLTGLLVGAAPAWQVTRDLRAAIVSGGRGAIGGGRLRARGLLIGTEVALAVALLAGAGLLLKSLRTLLAEDPGFRADGVLTADLSLPPTTYTDTARVASYYRQLLASVATLPGVTSAGVINAIPIGGGGGNSRFAVDGGAELIGDTDYRVVDSAYFRTMGIPLVMGRSFAAGDGPGAEHVTVINRAMAQKFWPGTSPLGHRIRFPGMDDHGKLWLTVVGVVGDVRSEGLDTPAAPASFVYYAQRPERMRWGGVLVVRGGRSSGALGDAVRRRVRDLDANVPVRVTTLASVVHESVAERRFSASVLSAFAGLALLLAAVGIHGVLAYLVAQRQREIGVRMALGAGRGTVRVMVLRDAMRAVLPGVAAGVATALLLSRLLRGLLYGVSATDPAVLAAVAAILTAVALAAAWLPARRATKVDPLVAIRSD